MPDPTNSNSILRFLDLFADGDLFIPREVPLADRLFPAIPISTRSKVWRGGESFRAWSRRMDGKPREGRPGWGAHPDLAISEWPPSMVDFKRWGQHPVEILYETPDCAGHTRPFIAIDVGLTTGVAIYGGRSRGKSRFSEFVAEIRALGYQVEPIEPNWKKPDLFFWDDPVEDIRRAKDEMLLRDMKTVFYNPGTALPMFDEDPKSIFIRTPPDDPPNPGQPAFDAPNRKRFKRTQRKRR